MLLPLGYDRNQPLTFKLGAGQVIKGFVMLLSPPMSTARPLTHPFRWDQGLLDMCIGEKRCAILPTAHDNMGAIA